MIDIEVRQEVDGPVVARAACGLAWATMLADLDQAAFPLLGALDPCGDAVVNGHKTYAHLMPDTDERGRKAIDQFFRRTGREGSALDVPSHGA